MKLKFDLIWESMYNRYTDGAGFLAGDLVEFKKGFEKTTWFQDQSEGFQALMRAMNDSKNNLRISSLKSETPRAAGSFGMAGGQLAVPAKMADIYEELSPGQWINPITVPLSILKIVDHGYSMPPISPNNKRKDKIEKEDKVSIDDKELIKQTKIKGGNQELPTKDTKNPHQKSVSDDRYPGGKKEQYTPKKVDRRQRSRRT